MKLEKPLRDRFVIPQQSILTQKTDFYKQTFHTSRGHYLQLVMLHIAGYGREGKLYMAQNFMKARRLKRRSPEKCLPSELNMGCLGRKADM